jgi:PAS domain S-box-containing protein
MTQKLTNPDILLAILDQMPTPIYVKDKDAKFVYVNQQMARENGVTPDELIGKDDFDLHHLERAQGFHAIDMGVIKNGADYAHETTVNLSDGLSHTVMVRKSRLTSPDGEAYLLGTNSDMSEIRRRENQYKALSETVPVGVAQIDEKLCITFANPLFNAYCGGDGTECDHTRLIQKLRATNGLFPGQACKFETEIQGLGTQPRAVIVISSGWLDLGDVSRTATVSLIDISQMTELQRINDDVSRLNTELAENVKKLNAMQDELLKKGRMEQLGQLTATVAHELRNPLGAVRTSVFLLERKLKDKGLNVETQIDRINKGVSRCDDIITQLLDFSRSKQLKFQPGDLDGWLAGVVEEEAKRLPSSVSIELLLGLNGCTVPFDPARLQRAVINMISNAVEAMVDNGERLRTSHGQPPKITISTFYKNDHVSMRVIDNGPGIPAEVLARIREPLYTTKNFGTGLGIPAIEQIAVQHGGRLDITTEVGAGSAFTVWLPIQAKPENEVGKAA